MPSNVTDDVIVPTPLDMGARREVARSCSVNLGMKLPALVDTFDNRTEIAYTAWPDRLYVVDREGRIAHKSAPGPFGFDPEGVRATLERLLAGGNESSARPTS